MAFRVHKSTLKIKNKMVGHVIGKGGWRIEEIRRDTNTKIYFGKEPDKNGDVECTITGRDFQGVELAKVKISTIVNDFQKGKIFARPPIQPPIPDTVETKKILKDISIRKNLGGNSDLLLKVHHTLVGQLIGKDGCRIKEISRGSNSQIFIGKEIDKKGKMECWIRSNDVANKERAKRMIENYLDKFKEEIRQKKGGNKDLVLNIHHKLIVPLLEENGRKVKEIARTSKTQILIEKEIDEAGNIECRIKSEFVANRKIAKSMLRKFLTKYQKEKLGWKNGTTKIFNKKKIPKLKPKEKFQPVSDKVALNEENVAAKEIWWKRTGRKGNKSCWRCDKKFGKYTNPNVLKHHSAKCVKLGNSKEAYQRNITKRIDKQDSKCEWSCGCDVCGNLFLEAKDLISHLEGRERTNTKTKRGMKTMPNCLETMTLTKTELTAPVPKIKNLVPKPNWRKPRVRQQEKTELITVGHIAYISLKFKDFELKVNLEM